MQGEEPMMTNHAYVITDYGTKPVFNHSYRIITVGLRNYSMNMDVTISVFACVQLECENSAVTKRMDRQAFIPT